MSELEEAKLNPDLKTEEQTLNEPISLSDAEETSSLVSDDSSVVSQEDVPIEQDLTIVDSVSDTEDDDDDDDEDILSHSPVPSSASEEDTDKSPIGLSETDDDADDTDDNTDDEIESDMLKKLEKDTYEDILLSYHPEIKQNNYNEILAMCKITRGGSGIISDMLHRTLPWLTKYERARVLGLRSKQLSNGADAFIEIPSGMISGYKIAVEELSQKRIPFIIRRPIPNGGSEYWKLEDLELLNSY